MKTKSNLLFLLLVVLLTIPAVIALFHPGFFVTDDGNWMIIRFSAFYESLRSGQFPVRFLYRLNNSYGYPVADFLYPLFMYIGTLIHVIGFSFVNTIKIILGLSIFASSIFTYLWLRKFFNKLPSLVGAISYTFFPYHLYDIYTRGSVGEVLALSIVPFILWQIEKKSLFLTSFGIALLILSHNSLALLFLPVIILYMFFRVDFKREIFKKEFIKQLAVVSFGLFLSAFFWLPALYDRQYTVFDRVAVSDFSNYFINYESIGLFGIISLTVFLSSLILFFINKNKLFSYFFLLSTIFALLTLPFSKIIWDFIPITNLVQFPFRLLSVVCLGIAFLISFQINLLKGKRLIIVSILYILLIFISSKNFIYPKSFENYPDTYYSTNQDSTTVKNEYMPKWVKEIPQKNPSEKVTVIKGNQSIENLNIIKNKITFNFYAPSETLIQVNTVYYPGWIVLVDGKKTAINYEDNGLIRFLAPKGSHSVEVKFQETPFRLFADFISIFSFFGLILILKLSFFKNKRKKS